LGLGEFGTWRIWDLENLGLGEFGTWFETMVCHVDPYHTIH